MAVQITDEDFQLMVEALENSGWQAVSLKGTKNHKENLKSLRTVLQAFIDGKVSDEVVKEKSDLFMLTPDDLEDQQAIAILTEAVHHLGITASVQSHTPTKEVHSLEHGYAQVVTGPTEVTMDLTLHKFQIKGLVNFIKNHPFFKWA